MNKKIFFRALLSLIFLSLFSLTMCQFGEPPVILNPIVQQYGNLTIYFDLESQIKADTRDFNDVQSGKVLLKRYGTTLISGDLIIDTQNMTGECELINVAVGSYDVIIELYNGPAGEDTTLILYSGENNVTITQGDNNSITIDIFPHIGSLVITGEWIEDISNLVFAIAQLRQEGVAKYTRNLVLNIPEKTISGNFPYNIYPRQYELYVAILDSEEQPIFTYEQLIIIERGINSEHLTLELNTGNIQIQVNGDVSPPVISNIAVSTGNQESTVTWTTDEPATSNICYSETPDFDYTTTRTWAPLEGDLTADTINHSVTVTGLNENTDYYYVIVTTDASGNLTVSDEGMLSAGLIGEWLFAGNAQDTSGYDHHGTINGATLTTDRFGNAESAYYFDRTAHIEIPDSADLEYSSMTICVWAQDDRDGSWQTGENSQGAIISKHVSTVHKGFYIGNSYGSSQTILYIGHEGPPDDSASASTSLINSSWHFITGMYNNGEISLYIDGVLRNTVAITGKTRSPANIMFGSLSPGGPYSHNWEGKIDDARIFNRALSESEIRALYEEGGWPIQ